MIISIILLIAIVVLNVIRYNRKKLDDEFEERMKSEDKALRQDRVLSEDTTDNK